MSAPKVYGIRSLHKGEVHFLKDIFVGGRETRFVFVPRDQKSEAVKYSREEAYSTVQQFPGLGRVVILRGLADKPAEKGGA